MAEQEKEYEIGVEDFSRGRRFRKISQQRLKVEPRMKRGESKIIIVKGRRIRIKRIA